MDYQKAIQNLTDVLIDKEKFEEIQLSIFDAIDTDNSGSLDVKEVKEFVANLLKGITHESSEGSADVLERHKIVFALLEDNESGEITQDDLDMFLRALFKEQIKELQAVMANKNK